MSSLRIWIFAVILSFLYSLEGVIFFSSVIVSLLKLICLCFDASFTC